MSEVKWIKIYCDIFDHPKIKYLESLPEGDSLVLLFVRLLAIAGGSNSDGYLMLTENIPYTDESLVSEVRKPLNIVRVGLKCFSELGMIYKDENGIGISNWSKYQNVEGMDKIREQNRIRKQNERKRKKLKQEELKLLEAAKTDVEKEESHSDMSRDSHATVTEDVTKVTRENRDMSRSVTHLEQEQEQEQEYVVEDDQRGTSNLKIILDLFSEKSKIMIPTPIDIQVARDLLNDNIPMDIILRGIKKSFSSYKKKHPKDKINSLKYCEGLIRTIWATESSKPAKKIEEEEDHHADFAEGAWEYADIGIVT